MQIERFQWKETSRIVEMICQVWKLDRMFKSLKNGMIFSQEYFYDVLLHSTDLFIATKQQRIVGFLALSLSKKEKILITIIVKVAEYAQRFVLLGLLL